jgi:hypothetical protein
MTTKGFAEKKNIIMTPNDDNITGKPLNTDLIKAQRVDINVLKAKLQKTESKEFKKNIAILSSLVVGLGAVGIYLSL